MKRLFGFLILLGLCAAPLCAQAVAKYDDVGDALYGTRNMTAQYDPTTPPSVPASNFQEGWAESIEDDRWIITAWIDFQLVSATQVNFEYRWRAYDKSTGYYSNYVSTSNMVGTFADHGNSIGSALTVTYGNPPSLQNFRALRPSLTFTTSDGSPDGYSGVAMAIVDIDVFTNAPDVFVYFLRIDPMTAPPLGTQPEWTQDFDRIAVNASGSPGESNMPNVDGLSNGELVVTWRDFSSGPNDEIGGRQSITPTVPQPNPSALAAVDVYTRRFQSQFSSGGLVDGAVDSKIPASTQNVTNSTSFEVDLDTASNGINTVYALIDVFGGQVDNVVGLGTNSGPIGGAFGAESSDVYVRIINTNGTNDITPGAAVNVSASAGTSAANPNYIAYNNALGQVGVLFFDNTTPAQGGGVGANTGISAVQQGQSPNLMPQYDAFVRVFRNDLTQVNTVAVTQSALFEAAGDISAFSQNGWVVGYSVLSTSTTTNDIASYHARVDATGKLAGTSSQSPRQAIVQNGGLPTTLLYSISTWPQESVSIIFNHGIDANGGPAQEGVPEFLRTTPGPLDIDPERPSATGSSDLFLMVGKPNTSNPAQGQIRISDFVVNNGDPIDPNAPPLQIPVSVSLENASPSAALSLDQLQISTPAAFSESGTGPALPVTLFPGGQASFNYDFDVNASELKAGSNTFSLSVSGFIAGFPTLSTLDSSLAVLGVEGSLVGVDVIAQFNPTVLTAGTSSEIEVTVAVSNGGQETLRNMEIEGGLQTGFLPTDLRNKVFSPDPRITEIPAGAIEIFTTTISVSQALKDNVGDLDGYRPAVTLIGEQSSGQPGAATRMGSVTIQSQVGIRIDPKPESEKAIPLALINGGGPGGCALSTTSTTGMALLALLMAMGGVVLYRRRSA